jgi:transcription antitermination factor NusG
MPLLKQEIDLYPSNLLELEHATQSPWWAMYTVSRQEKKLMRQLEILQIPFYGPTISRRYRAPNGRLRTSIEPLFNNYVFVCGEESARYKAVCTGTISRWMQVHQPLDLLADLRQIRDLVLTGAPLAPERRIEVGQQVRVRTGLFKGFEGTVLRRENQIRLLVGVRYMGQGASVALDDCQVDVI